MERTHDANESFEYSAGKKVVILDTFTLLARPLICALWLIFYDCLNFGKNNMLIWFCCLHFSKTYYKTVENAIPNMSR